MDRNQFLKPIALKTKTVDIEGFGSINLKEMSASQSAKYEMFLNRTGTEADRKLKLITLCVVDESNELMLSEADFPHLREMPANVINQIVFEVMKINGYLKDNTTQEQFEDEFQGELVA